MSHERASLVSIKHFPLPSQDPHSPACYEDSTQEHGEAIEAVAHHFARRIAVCDAEDDGCEERED